MCGGGVLCFGGVSATVLVGWYSGVCGYDWSMGPLTLVEGVFGVGC